MKFRKICFKIVQWEHFESIILVLIIFSSIKLAIDTYFLDDPTTQIEMIYFNISQILDYTFNICFIIECLLKIISYGFLLDKNTYLRGIKIFFNIKTLGIKWTSLLLYQVYLICQLQLLIFKLSKFLE